MLQLWRPQWAIPECASRMKEMDDPDKGRSRIGEGCVESYPAEIRFQGGPLVPRRCRVGCVLCAKVRGQRARVASTSAVTDQHPRQRPLAARFSFAAFEQRDFCHAAGPFQGSSGRGHLTQGCHPEAGQIPPLEGVSEAPVFSRLYRDHRSGRIAFFSLLCSTVEHCIPPRCSMNPLDNL